MSADKVEIVRVRSLITKQKVLGRVGDVSTYRVEERVISSSPEALTYIHASALSSYMALTS